MYQGNYTVIGPPGTGKTTFLSEQVKKIVGAMPNSMLGGRSPVLVCSLTKTAAQEAAGRNMPIPEEAVATLHAHGYRAMGKPAMITGKAVSEGFNKENPGFAITPEEHQLDGDDIDGPKDGEMPGDEYAGKYHLYRHAMKPRETWDAETLAWARFWERWKEENNIIDFTDMIEMAPDQPPFDPKVVIVDEAQDLSKLEFNLIRKWGKTAGATIAVGDPYQALYTWRGAHPEYLLDNSDVSKSKVLSQSHRVPGAVHREAMSWISGLSNYKHIEYKPTQSEGVVDVLNSVYTDPVNAVDLAVEKANEGKRVMLITSCNYMCNPIVHYMRENGIPFSNPWRISNAKWNPVGPRRGTSMKSRLVALLQAARPIHGDDRRMWTIGEFASWAGILKAKGFFKRGAKSDLEELAKQYPDERLHSLHIEKFCETGDMFNQTLWDRIWQWFQDTDAGQKRPLSELFDLWTGSMDKVSVSSAKFLTNMVSQSGYKAITVPPKIHVGTIHSFKGGEADVVILFPDLSMTAHDNWIMTAGEEYDSIVRAFYVGMTRSQSELYLCNACSERAVEW